jgi:hypothetical protein
MRLAATILTLILCLAAVPVIADTYLVKDDGTGDFPTIQDAVNAAAPGDTILLANGTFTGPGNRDVLVGALDLTIRSQSGQTHMCTIDCQGDSLNEHRAFTFSAEKQGGQPAVEYINIKNGYVDPTGSGTGGAVLCLGVSVVFRGCYFSHSEAAYGGAIGCGISGSPSFYDCVIEQNSAIAGGGILCEACSPAIVDSRVTNNMAVSAGGGILFSNASGEITSSIVDYNTVDVPATKKSTGVGRSGNPESSRLVIHKSRDEAAPDDGTRSFDDGGAGICVFGTSSCLVADCDIRYNHATTSGHFYGGGIGAQYGPTLTVTGCRIESNEVTGHDASDIAGGGIDAWATDLTVENCDIWDNHLWREGTSTFRSGFGGGINAPMPPAKIADCWIAGNGAGLGGGIHMSDQWGDSKGEAIISGCTIAGNYASEAGGGIHADPFLTTVENTTVTGNLAGESGGGIYTWSGWTKATMKLNHTILWGNCVEGGTKGITDEAYFGSPAEFVCCDVYKAGVSSTASVVYDPTTFDADPKFCNPAGCLSAPTSDGIYSIHNASPCAPERAPCGLIGSLGVGCGGTITVCPDGTGDYEKIQDAVDAAWDGDIIELCDGVYTGQGNTVIEVTKPVIIRSKSGNPDACVIDMENYYGWGVAFADPGPAVKGGPKSGLENVTIRNGGYELGGGILCSGGSPTIRGCKIENCIAYIGGGIAVMGDSPVISHCEVAGCMAWICGGGIFLIGTDLTKAVPPAPVLDSCYIHDNVSGFIPVARAQHEWTGEHMEKAIPGGVQKWLGDRGGFIPGGAGVGAMYYVEPLLTGCTIRNNTALPPMIMAGKQEIAEFVMGGGLSWSYASGGKIQDCVIRQNAVDFTELFPDKGPYIPGYGGGIALAMDSSPIIEGCAIDSNYVDLRVDIAPAGPADNFEMEPFQGLRQKGPKNPLPGGGGIFSASACSPLIVGCSIMDNYVESWTVTPPKVGAPEIPVGGGGLSFQFGGTLTMRDCTVHSNVVRERTGTGYVILAGGGLFAYGATTKFEGCTFTENTLTVPFTDKKDGEPWEWHPERGNYPSYGGGLAFSECLLDLADCTVADNMAYTGGGMYVESPPGPVAEKAPGQVGWSYIRNSLVIQNIAYTGGGIRQVRGTLDIYQSTISGNLSAYAAGIHQESLNLAKQPAPEAATILEHSILWGNCTEEYGSDQDMYFTGQAEFECCDVNKAGVLAESFPPDYDVSTISEDPMFCCPAYCDLIFQGGIGVPFWTVGDYRIDYFSPCTKRNAPCGKQIGALGVGCRGNHCEPWEFLPPESFASVLEAQLAGGKVFRLLPPTPNPFNPVAEIHFSIPAGSDASRVTLTVYNALGQRVRTLVDEDLAGGMHQSVWDGADENGAKAASGVYFCSLRWNGRSETERMILLK